MRTGVRVSAVALAVLMTVLTSTSTARACDAGVELLITELMALNLDTVTDEDGSYEDWIEIYNPCLASVDVGGWYLTDDPANLTKWQFPSIALGRGEFLLVFASGKDRAMAGAPLHTNFKLASEGDYLALVKPDGTTIAQEFAPAFPPQLADVSYGLPQAQFDLVSTGDTVSYRVPVLADSGIGTAWAGLTWDDSAWATGPTGLGFTTSGSGAFDVTFYKANVTVSNLTVAEAVIADPLTQSYVANETAPVINYLNSGGAGHFGSDSPFPSTTIGQDANDFVVLVTANILIPTAGEWTFGVNSDDGFGLELTREPHAFAMSYPGTRGASDTLGVFDIPEAGVYSVRLVSFERGGGSSLEFFAAAGNHSSFNGNFALVGDTANGGLGLGNIGAQIRTDVQSVMRDVNASIWSRAEFSATDPSTLGLLTLRVAYEDGFVAYLNGTEVASANAPSPVYWDSTSLVDRPVEEAAVLEAIDLTDDLHLLVPGLNVLAVQGLNDVASDGDFLTLAELSAAEDTVDSALGSFFTGATPGEYNSGGYPGVSGIPFFSHASGSFTDPFSLSIFAAAPGAVIRYTTNGTEPTETNGTVYTVPILIDNSRRIRARVFESGLAPGAVHTRLFTMLDLDVIDFDSNLPIVVVNTFGSGISTNFFAENLISVIPKIADRVSIMDPPQFEGLAGIKIRGSSSTQFPKKQYALETWDPNFQDLDVALLDMPPESDWILYAPYSDKALMRNVLSYQWSNDIGRYAVRTQFVEMFLQTGTGPVDSSDYVGVYVLTEKIKRNPNRVPITRLEPNDDAEPEITGGYMLKKDRLDPGDSGFSTSTGQRLAYVDPKEVEITAPQAAWIKAYLDGFETALYGPDFADPVLGYAPYIDPGSFIDHHILVEVTKNIDGYRLSTFMFKDRNSKLNMGPIWDYNLSLGNANYLQGWLPQGWYYALISSGNYPWYGRLFQDEAFSLAYADRWYALRRNEFRTEKMLGDVDGYATLLDESKDRNFVRWPILGVYVWPNWFIANTFQEEIDWMKGWLEDRLLWMDGQFFAPPSFNHPEGEIPAGFNLTMTSPFGVVYYTLDGTDPRLSDGSIAPTAIAYAGPLQITSPVQIKARALDSSTWSAINSGFFDPLPLAYINEVLPDNQTVHADEQGEFDPWIELYNPFSTTVDLGGLFLTDDLGAPFKWPIPAGTTLCPNLWLLIWADGETTEGPFHASFTLDPAGGNLWLYDASGYLLDSLTYPALGPDESYGRRPDGGADLGRFSYPTPVTANPGIGVPILVNEYNAVAPGTFLDNSGSDVFWGQVPGNGGDWFELVVVEDGLDIRDWSVTVEDNAGAVSTTLTFTTDTILSNLRSGTIITVGPSPASNVSYDPVNGDWWIHLQSGFAGDGLYISNLDFSISNQDTWITVSDDIGTVVFGPAGEGINPPTGIGADEVFKLEEDPGPSVTAYSNYQGGSTSTFGAPNRWDGGAGEQSFVVLRSVVAANCTLDTECNDGNPCTDDVCNAGTCENQANVATCDDGNPCTQNDLCSAGQCRGEIIESCCVADCECDDGDVCTTDQCIANTCVNDSAPTGTSCDDGDLCTVNDACDQGLCLGGGPPDCTSFDDDCNLGVCNPVDGSCEAQTTNEGGACDDGDLCNTAKTCSLGVCEGGVPVDCSGLDDDCNVGVCTPGVGCEIQTANEGGACDDGDLCTTGETCSAGACGAPVDCSPVDDPCNVGVCNPTTGACEPQPLADGTTCEDGNACTADDTCQLGVCTGGAPPDCDDANECTDDTCDDLAGCQSTPVLDGTTCDDGDLCTETDICGSGACAGTALDCSSLDDVCNVGACNAGSGLCEAQPSNEGGTCDDSELCTENDVCTAGVCGGSALDCSAEDDACFVGVCNSGTGICEPVEQPDGTACDDGDACTMDTTCTTGVCGDPTPVTCDDGNSCTVDTCDSGTGCIFTPDDDQDENSEPDPCDDGDLCTVTDVCTGGVCGGVAMDCSVLDDQCNLGICNATTGVCEPLNLTTGTPCDDANACTVGDSCDTGACVPGAPADCDDGNVCTIDSCDSVAGCLNDPDPGAICDDGTECTETDTCDAAGACAGTAVLDGTLCDDSQGCTENDFCTSGVCGGDPVDCSSFDGPCAVGVCNPVSGTCEAQAINEGFACDDGDLCTDNGMCIAGVCAGTTTDCSGLDDSCNVGVCNPGTGLCETAPVLDGTPCDDDNLCTDNDLCSVGVCAGGQAVDCSGLDDDCILGVCNPVSGACEAQPYNEGLSCNDADLCTTGDVCTAGVCGGTLVSCSFLDDDCNVGVCNPGSGACVLQSVNEGGVCDDGDLCTENDSCSAGFCSGGPVDCSGLDDSCNFGVCIPSTGSCELQPGNEGAACTDGDLCTQDDVCAAGVCVGGAVDCSGLDDSCNVGVCNAGDGSCEAQPINEGLTCTDGDPCTLGDVCATGVCLGVPLDCDDGNACTTDVCLGGACDYQPSGACQLSGTVSYYRDSVGGLEPSTKPVPDVEIDIDGDAAWDVVTDSGGVYSVPNLAGTFNISPTPNLGTGEVADAYGAITSFDASIISQFSVQMISLSAMQEVAADVSGNGSVSSFDAALVSQLAVQILEHFFVAQNAGSDWAYYRCDNYVDDASQDCANPLYVYDPLTQPEANPFYAVLYGDVTGNWEAPPPPGARAVSREPSQLEEASAAERDRLRGVQLRTGSAHRVTRQRERSAPATLTLEGWSGPMHAGEQRELLLSIGDADGIEALDLKLSYDPAKVSIVEVRAVDLGAELNVVAHDIGGVRNVGMYGILPLEGSGTLLSVTIASHREIGATVPIEVTGEANESLIPLRILDERPGGAPGPRRQRPLRDVVEE